MRWPVSPSGSCALRPALHWNVRPSQPATPIPFTFLLGSFGSLDPIAARPLGSSFKTARWNEVLDGILIFREEQAPEFPRR